MHVDAAMVREQGVAVVVVKRWVLDNPPERERTRSELSLRFGRRPTVLMAPDAQGTPTYHGRPDIVRFLANVLIQQLPWRRYWVN